MSEHPRSFTYDRIFHSRKLQRNVPRGNSACTDWMIEFPFPWSKIDARRASNALSRGQRGRPGTVNARGKRWGKQTDAKRFLALFRLTVTREIRGLGFANKGKKLVIQQMDGRSVWLKISSRFPFSVASLRPRGYKRIKPPSKQNTRKKQRWIVRP